MSDTSDVLDTVTKAAAEALYGAGSWPFNAATGYDVEAESTHMANYLLEALTDAGYVVVRGDGLQHGDELVQVGYFCEGLGHEHRSRHDKKLTTVSRSLNFDGACASSVPALVVRRSVPENGDT